VYDQRQPVEADMEIVSSYFVRDADEMPTAVGNDLFVPLISPRGGFATLKDLVMRHIAVSVH
jgi:hypothetical protein